MLFHNLHPSFRRWRLWLLLPVLMNACSSANGVPLQITDVSVIPDPIVGKIVTLQVEIMSTHDESNVTFKLDTLEQVGNKIHLISGETEWQGPLVANQPQTFQFSICVFEEGDWPIRIRAVSRSADGSGIWDAFETPHLKSTTTTGEIIQSGDYTFSQTFEPTPIPYQISPDECVE